MRRAALLGLIAACSGGPARDVRRDDLAQRVSSANAIDLAKMLHAPLGYGGLSFDDPACNAEFIAPGMVGADRIDAFAGCVAGLHLVESDRKSPFPDVVVLDYPPGFEVEAEFQVRDTTTIRWIGYAGRHDFRDALPAVSPQALEALRVVGAPQPVLDHDAAARLGRERSVLGIDHSHVWLKVCIDGEGNVTGAHPREETSPIAGEVFSAAAMQWKFRPFVAGGRALPVCSLVAMMDPPDDGAATALPFPVPAELGSVIVSPTALRRIEGSPQIHPDDDTALEMQQGGGGHFYAAYAYCIDEQGNMSAVQALRKFGFPRYDDKILAAIRTWKYKPFVVEGKPVSACAALTFFYFSRR